MVAKFREKCCMSSVALEQLMHQITKLNKPENDPSDRETKTRVEENINSETLYESIEYADENVEYVIYETGTDFIDESEISEKSQENDIDSVEEEIDNRCQNVSQMKAENLFRMIFVCFFSQFQSRKN